jgi:hypothetical protein
MKQNTPIIPESIADQLRLWEAEDRRLSLSPGYFYDDFASRTPFFVPPFFEHSAALTWSSLVVL